MLGSILRYCLFIALVAAATWGVYQLMETPGAIVVSFANYEYTLTPLAFVVLAAIGFAALLILFKIAGLLLALYRFICGDETAISRFFNRSRERRGFDSLSQALTALAEGDGAKAKTKAEKAERLLERPEITQLVTAQAAEMSGDLLKARKYYKALAEEKRSSYAGVKGLLELANAEGDEDRALKLANQAYQLRPKNAWVLDNLYNLQSRSFDWKGARKTLTEQKRAGLLPKTEANRRDAMLALAQSEDAEELGHHDSAKRLAIDAAKLDPLNADAVTKAVRYLVAGGSKRAANRLITKAWGFTPGPQLAAAYASIEPDETPAQRADRFKKLFDIKSTGTEANLVRAELALTVEDWAEARRAMSKIEENEPSARSCAIMAAIARGEGEPDAVVRGWLAKALGAPRGADEASVLDHAAMLPLLVGEEHETSAAETVADAEPETVPPTTDDTAIETPENPETEKSSKSAV